MEHRPFEFDRTAAAGAALLAPAAAPRREVAAVSPAPRPAPAPDGGGANPWAVAAEHGRTAFLGALSDVAKGKRNWQVAFYGLLFGVVVPETLSLATLATQARITPYVVRVDRHGQAQGFGPADRTSTSDPVVTASALAGWVHDVRGVSTDPVAQHDMVDRAYAFVDQNSAQFLKAYFTDPAHDPRVLGQTLSRLVEVTSVLPLPRAADATRGGDATTTWKLSWTETDYARGGGEVGSTAWEGYVTTRHGRPPEDKRGQVNPLGLFVGTITWTKIASRPAADGAPADSPAALPAPASGTSTAAPNVTTTNNAGGAVTPSAPTSGGAP